MADMLGAVPLTLAAALMLLSSCAPPMTPAPAPVLEFQRLSAGEVRAVMTPPPAAPLRWSLRRSVECGADNDAGAELLGVWPAHHPALLLPATLAHLVRVELPDGSEIADCP